MASSVGARSSHDSSRPGGGERVTGGGYVADRVLRARRSLTGRFAHGCPHGGHLHPGTGRRLGVPAAVTQHAVDQFGEWLVGLLRGSGRRVSRAERLERIVLGGPRRLTRIDVESRSGVSRDRNERLWRALGFADVHDDDVVFTDADVEAVTLIDGLIESGVVDPTLEAAVARAAGQSLSRLAEWEIGLLYDHVASHARDATDDADADDVVRLAEAILPIMEQLHSYVWRRHVAALAGRALAGSLDELSTSTLVVGFVDVVGYTRLSRNLSDIELVDLLERFESIVADLVAGAGGRVVKTLGDEVLFTVTDPRAAAAIALGLLDAISADDVLPDVRIGMALGNVVRRFGDVYGPVVNIASRLTSAAKRATAVVDQEMATNLAGQPGLRLHRRRPVAVRGYNTLASWRLTRAPTTSRSPPSAPADRTPAPERGTATRTKPTRSR
jgi:adenylate cyclase